MNTSHNCSNCKFWSPLAGGQGQCRLNPPSVAMLPVPQKLSNQTALQPVSFWPITTSAQWCGQYQPDLVVDPR